MAGSGRWWEIAIATSPFDPGAGLIATANLVQVDVTVLEGNGRAAAGLGRKDFQIEDDGQAQQISGFEAVRAAKAAGAAGGAGASAARSQARTVLLYFDDLETPSSQLAYARNAALGFLGGTLPAGERIGVVTSSGRGELAATSDVGRLRRAVAAIIPHPYSETGMFCPLITPEEGFDIIHMGEGSEAMQFAMA